ncbi:hypothetical protein ACH0BU_07850 [Sphingomonas olei]
MTIMSVDTSRLSDPRIVAHLDGIDSRIINGFRLALDVLCIPMPKHIERKPAGRPSIAKLMAAADADSGTIYTYRDEKMKIGASAPKL